MKQFLYVFEYCRPQRTLQHEALSAYLDFIHFEYVQA